jgi:hypothetical protein
MELHRASETAQVTSARALTELFNSREIIFDKFRPSSLVSQYLRDSPLSKVPYSLSHWSDGLTAEIAADGRLSWLGLRIHRDGAIGIAQQFPAGVRHVGIARFLNEQLCYLAWFWNEFQLQRPMELELAVVGLRSGDDNLEGSQFVSQPIVCPPGLDVDHVSIQVNEVPWELKRAASVRHRIVWRLADRLRQAYGDAGAISTFEQGWLYDSEGKRLRLALGQGRLWDPTRGQQGLAISNVDTQGRIYGSDGTAKSFVVDGVLVDSNGLTLATLEMAPGVGCPDDFLPTMDDYALSPMLLNVPRVPSVSNEPVPNPVGQWSNQRLIELLN